MSISRSKEFQRQQLMRQYVEVMGTKLSGFDVSMEDNNVSLLTKIFKWRVVVDGPPDTLYEGGKFVALLEFPKTFPFYPPRMKFTTNILHPNSSEFVDRQGQVCISILHPPGNDPFGYEGAAERWRHTRTVESVLVSVRLLIAEPNFDSPANVDASLLHRNDPERYKAEVRQCAERAANGAQQQQADEAPMEAYF